VHSGAFPTEVIEEQYVAAPVLHSGAAPTEVGAEQYYSGAVPTEVIEEQHVAATVWLYDGITALFTRVPFPQKSVQSSMLQRQFSCMMVLQRFSLAKNGTQA
jgi:hypothetical protein